MGNPVEAGSVNETGPADQAESDLNTTNPEAETEVLSGETDEQSDVSSETSESAPEVDDLDKLRENSNVLRVDFTRAKKELDKDLKAFEEQVKPQLSDVSAESLAMSRELEGIEERIENIDSQIDSAELGAPNQLGEAMEPQSLMMEARQMSQDLLDAEEEMEKAREEALNKWIEECIEYADGGDWKSLMDRSENRLAAKKMIAAKLKLFLTEEGQDFVKGSTDELPGWYGLMYSKEINTEEGKETYITKITIGPHEESLSVPKGGEDTETMFDKSKEAKEDKPKEGGTPGRPEDDENQNREADDRRPKGPEAADNSNASNVVNLDTPQNDEGSDASNVVNLETPQNDKNLEEDSGEELAA